MTEVTLESCRRLFGDVVQAAAIAATGVMHAGPLAASASASASAEEEHDHDHDHDHGSDAEHAGHTHGGYCSELEGKFSVGLHVAAIFIVFAASAIGTLIPLLGRRVPALRVPAYAYAVGKAAATGVVMAVAMIHMISEASGRFELDCIPETFQDMYEGWACLFAMIAAILMHALDGTLMWIAESWAERRSRSAVASARCDDSLCKECPAREALEQQRADGSAAVEMEAQQHSGGAAVALHDADGGCGHQHGVAVPEDMPAVQRVVSALCMEFGVTLHSVFAGLTLGVSADSDAKGLLVALVFHQLFEGLAMGSRLADASFHLTLEAVLMLVFSLSTSVGIAAGTGAISSSSSALSGTSYAMVSAVLDSVCGGIMLYIAFNLLFVDFMRDLATHCCAGSAHRVWKRMGLYAGLWIGAGVMALIGKWL